MDLQEAAGVFCRRVFRCPWLFILVGSTLFGGCGKETPPSPAAERLPVTFAVARRGSLTLYQHAFGSVEALESPLLGSRVSAAVDTVFVEEGDSVRGGTLLVALDTSSLSVQIALIESSISQASKKALELGHRLEGAKADLDQKNLELGRTRGLLVTGHKSQNDVDLAEALVRRAQAEVKANEKAIEAANHGIALTRSKKRLLELEKSWCLIRAPSYGVWEVVEKRVDAGDVVEAGTPLIGLIRRSPLRGRIWIGESYVQKMDLDNTVDLEVGGGIVRLQLKPKSFGFQVEEMGRSMPLLFDLPNEDGRIRPGLSLSGAIPLVSESNGVVIPRRAVRSRGNRHLVFLLSGGIARQRTVELGLASKTEIVIDSGLLAGDTVAVIGVVNLSDGLPVRITDHMGDW